MVSKKVLISISALILIILFAVFLKSNYDDNNKLDIVIQSNDLKIYEINVLGNEEYYSLYELDLEKYIDYTEVIEINKFNGDVNICNQLTNDSLDIKVLDKNNKEIVNTKNLSPTHSFNFKLSGEKYIVLIKKS